MRRVRGFVAGTRDTSQAEEAICRNGKECGLGLRPGEYGSHVVCTLLLMD